MPSSNKLCAALLFLSAATAFAHPMGNLSVNHYARLEPSSKGVDLTYVLDLAEIPTFETMQTWGLKEVPVQSVLNSKARAQAALWMKNLVLTENGKPVIATLGTTSVTVIDGAGNLPVFRIEAHIHTDAKGGQFAFEDGNFPTRAGWREISVAVGNGARIERSTHTDRELSKGLTAYPQDPTAAPPQDTRAAFTWVNLEMPALSRATPVAHAPAPVIQAPAPVVQAPPPVVQAPAAVLQAPATAARPPDQPAAGTIQRGDRMSQLLQTLRSKDVSWSVFGLLLFLAFWFGALHALEPGHGKTMAAAYLVGARGTPKHAIILGASVTFTHTISVFLLGLATMFLSQYVMPDKITKWLGVISGLSIVWIGGLLVWKRGKVLASAAPKYYDHPDLELDHDVREPHEHGPNTHTHGGQSHSHAPEGEISMSSLIALGASGGLAPCPSALILLLSAISIGRPGLGVILLVAFSAGLAIVLTLTGLTVLYAKNLLPASQRSDNVVFRYMPVVSALAILAVGVMMTGVSMGWFPIIRFFG